MKTKRTKIQNFFGTLKGKDVEKARLRIKKWREQFSKDCQNRTGGLPVTASL